ncbi:MAG: cupin domain-containing protein [Acidobacteriota bacterium]
MAAPDTARRIARQLGLEPHPEGGFYRETYASALSVRGADVGLGDERRGLSTAIYYLLTPDTFSEMHRLDADEVWHHYLGDPVEQLQLRDDGGDEGGVVVLGPDLAADQRPQIIVPRGVWQGSRVAPGPHGFALCGTTMAPAFSFDGYEAGARDDLTRRFPAHRVLIEALTRT